MKGKVWKFTPHLGGGKITGNDGDAYRLDEPD
jgi:hypothetical protein